MAPADHPLPEAWQRLAWLRRRSRPLRPAETGIARLDSGRVIFTTDPVDCVNSLGPRPHSFQFSQERQVAMQKILAIVAMAVFSFALPSVAIGQELSAMPFLARKRKGTTLLR